MVLLTHDKMSETSAFLHPGLAGAHSTHVQHVRACNFQKWQGPGTFETICGARRPRTQRRHSYPRDLFVYALSVVRDEFIASARQTHIKNRGVSRCEPTSLVFGEEALTRLLISMSLLYGPPAHTTWFSANHGPVPAMFSALASGTRHSVHPRRRREDVCGRSPSDWLVGFVSTGDWAPSNWVCGGCARTAPGRPLACAANHSSSVRRSSSSVRSQQEYVPCEPMPAWSFTGDHEVTLATAPLTSSLNLILISWSRADACCTVVFKSLIISPRASASLISMQRANACPVEKERVGIDQRLSPETARTKRSMTGKEASERGADERTSGTTSPQRFVFPDFARIRI